ncbi:hypothetical protein [Streptomyces cyaneofuscatus]|uniref:hypothetical protein n=1 Tax=Streptomyces cyaneofuscatus TaxID=66883 RepID=UPI0038159B02
MVNLRRIKDFWSEKPAVDWLLLAILVGGHIAVSIWTSQSSIMHGVTADRRKDIYTTAASISALVGGFGTAAIAQYASSNGRDMRALRRLFGRSLRKNWSSILTGMLLVSAGCLALLVFDDARSAGHLEWVAEALLAFGAARSIRLVWLFNMLINVSDRDAVEPERSPALQFRTRE